MKKTSMPQDYKKDIDWIIDAYELVNVTFSDGFQKDAIQNAVGARGSNSWTNWKCNISYIKNEKGKFLVIEDEGTEGLTGPNISVDEINRMIDNDENIDPTWRLARFSSRNVSGGNQTGAGKYGVGKSVYSSCSLDYDYFYDSLRKDGMYVANRNQVGQIFEKAFEGKKAEDFINTNTGLDMKTTVGTRIIIVNPKMEIVESLDNGELEKFIQESWWRSIRKMDDQSGIYLNGKRVDLPEMPKFEHEFILPKPELYSQGYRIKNFGFFIEERGTTSKWHGISYYRRGMKIGNVDIPDIPAAIKDRYWGFIEVDKEWEESLADIEDAVHYGVKSGKKHTTTYQNMKLYASSKIQQLLVEWGYKKDKEFEDKKLQEALKEISSELEDLFDDMGFEDLGKGAKKPDFAVRWKDVKYPHDDTLTVINGEQILFGFRISNDYLTDRKFSYKLIVVAQETGDVVNTLDAGDVSLKSGEYFDKNMILDINPQNAKRYEENRIVLTVRPSASSKEKRKELPLFYDIEKEDNSRREVVLSMHTIDFPREDSRRVNFGESIKNISYLVENKRSFPLSFTLNVSLHNCEDPPNPKIKDIIRVDGYATPYEDVVIDGIPDILFDEAEISNYLEAGEMEIRARLIATEDSDEYEKGDKITKYYHKVYLNKDEKSGKDGSFEPRTADEPNNYRRSWCQGGNRIITINSGHPAYKASQEDDDDWKDYLKQEMLKQYVLLYLEEGKYKMFGDGKDITQMDPLESYKCVLDKIEEVYNNSFK